MYVIGEHFRQKFDRWIESSDVKESLDKELYRRKRYATAASIVMIHSDDTHFEEKFHIHTRRTDYIFPLAEKNYLLLYSHTDLEHAFKAVENLSLYLKNDSPNIAMTELKEDDDLDDVFQRVYTLFLIAIERGEGIVDDSFLEE